MLWRKARFHLYQILFSVELFIHEISKKTCISIIKLFVSATKHISYLTALLGKVAQYKIHETSLEDISVEEWEKRVPMWYVCLYVFYCFFYHIFIERNRELLFWAKLVTWTDFCVYLTNLQTKSFINGIPFGITFLSCYISLQRWYRSISV